MKIFFSCLLLSVISYVAYAQQQPWSEEGEIEDAEVIIEKDREIELPKANRNFERVPPLPVQKPQIDVSYRFVDLTPQLPDVTPQIRVLKVKEPPLPKLYGNYAKAGIANYITPYLELFVNNTRSKDYSYGLHFRHLSSRLGPVDQGNSGNSDTRLMLNGKYFAKNHTFSAEAGAERERYHYYGYAPSLELDRDSIRQNFTIGHFRAGLQKSRANAPVAYAMNVSFDRISDRFGATENQLGLDLKAGFKISDQLSLNIESETYLMGWQRYSFAAPEASSSISRNLVKFKPYFRYKTSEGNAGLEATAGFNIAYENDTILNGNRLHFYPNLWFTYYLGQQVRLYAGVDGDIQKTSWLDLTRENPYLSSDVGLAHTNRVFAFHGGLRGRVSSILGFHAGLQAGSYKNLYFFANSARDSTRFDVLYDTDNTFLLNLFGEINISSSERLKSALRADYYVYTTNEVAEPWHRPSFQLSLLADYMLYEKIIFNAELMVLTGIEGLNQASNTQRKLDSVADLSFKTDYLFSDRFSAFLQLKNIFAQNYERYLNYPSRGIMVMLGATYSF